MRQRICSGLIAVCFGILVLLVTVQPSMAASSEKSVKSLLRKHARITEQLRKKLAKASPAVLQKITSDASLKRQLTDSDGDGVPDQVENSMGLNSCNADSDDDGVDDGTEIENGTKPDEVETHGVISAMSLDSITVTPLNGAALTYSITNKTIIEGTLASLVVGANIEVEGKYVIQPDTTSLLVAKKIALEDAQDEDENENEHGGHGSGHN